MRSLAARWKRALPVALCGLAAVCLASPAAAKPAHLKALAEHYGPFLPKALNNCGTCHRGAIPGNAATLSEFPHNPFGDRLAAALAQLRTRGGKTDLVARLQAVAAEDTDGDGVANELELLAGSRPGEPKDRPSAVDLKLARKAQPRLRSYLASYRWRPFEPVPAVAPPKVKNAAWVRNPIDAFVAAEHEKRGLKPRPEASREVLLRRAYIDLTGLSPRPDEVRAFLADKSPDAYEKVVDRLLASPQYGERWGRHWMDVWRYSDWAGYGEQVRDSQPHIWRWRDWILESLNADKPYDRMIVEMLAADEAAPLDADALRATGFLVRNYKLLSREKWMQDTVDHTAQAFLGLTLGCARCHDHMYDPVTQKEYYQFRAIFEPHQVRTDLVPGELDPKKDGLPRVFDAKLDAVTYFLERGDERFPVKDKPMEPGVPESLGGRLEVQPVKLPHLARVPERQPHVIAALREDAEKKVTEARKAAGSGGEAAQLGLAVAEASKAALEAVLRVETLEDAGKKGSDDWKAAAEETVRLQRRQAAAEAGLKRFQAAQALAKAEKEPAKADVLKKAKEALAAAEEALKKAEAETGQALSVEYKRRIKSDHPESSSGRRLALAKWIASAENPLTARVAVNHVWLRHFGQALLPTVADFGRNGAPPTHPELLDWLAGWFASPAAGSGQYGSVGVREYGSRNSPKAQGRTPNALPHPHTPTRPYSHTAPSGASWSFKKLHRLIMLSSTYRMASTPDPANLKKDPDNLYLWRMSSRRMDAEIVRDNILHVAGRLDDTLGGPDIDQNLGLKVKRRSLYFRHAAEKEMVFLSLFDGPNVVECYRRKETLVPQQALALANSEIALVQSRLLARDLTQALGPDPGRFVETAFLQVLGRRPTKAETSECLAFLRKQSARLQGKPGETAEKPEDAGKPSADPALRARENLIMVLLNHNDFITVR